MRNNGRFAETFAARGFVDRQGAEPEMKKDEEKYMRRAIRLARKGEGWTNPNPLVGAVIVKNGEIIGEGFHHKYGEMHAEREALKNCMERGHNPAGATIYVTLEPCCHFGKQPPCSQAVAESGISRVVVGSRDPNPLVHGKGNEYLRRHGIEVAEDFLKEECDALNAIFFHYITTGRPYVALKYAMTLDGKIATATGGSKWISGEKSRIEVQKFRNRYAGILCGIGTVLKDNPMLNCRIKGGNSPVRIVCDSHLKIPLECNIVQSAKEIKTVVATLGSVEKTFAEKKLALEEKNVEVLAVSPDENGKISLEKLFSELGSRKIDSVLVEGGGEINFSVLEKNLADCIYAFIAPKIFGGTAKTPVSGKGILHPADAFTFNLKNIKHFDDDILLELTKN